jgi:protein SCO1/2
VLPELETMLADTGTHLSGQARAELQRAIDAIRPHRTASASGCCCAATPLGVLAGTPSPVWPSGVMPDVTFEDQDGTRLRYDDLFGGKPSIAVFFYTRCPNPNKCSLTITKLAQLQDAIAAAGVRGQLRTIAVTYDPDFDVPARLRAYGTDRGVVFDDDHRLVRTLTGFTELQERFQLGVNFTGSTVNRHRIELFVLDSDGDVAATFARLQWDVNEVLARARQLLT